MELKLTGIALYREKSNGTKAHWNRAKSLQNTETTNLVPRSPTVRRKGDSKTAERDLGTRL